jgi:RNA polymerase sigma-70 factor (ECF subfamily)
LGAWVRVVALNFARGGLRRRSVDARARTRLATQSEVTGEAGPVGDAVDVGRALSRLTRRQREVTVLHYFCDLSVREVAAELSVEEGTVKTLLHRARASLAEVLAEATEEVDRAG